MALKHQVSSRGKWKENLHWNTMIYPLKHERALWVEKHLQSDQQKKKTSTTSVREDSGSGVGGENEHLLVRSISDDSVLEKQTNDTWEWDKERAKSAVQVQNQSTRKPMVKRLEKCLKELKVPNAVWVLGQAGKFYQVNFCTAAGEQCEQIIQLLNEHDIGVEHNSTVSILPCTLYFEGKEHAYSPSKLTSPTMPSSSQRNSLQRIKEETGWERFVHSVRERLMVAQVIAGVKNNSTFTFDFLLLLIIASMTAAIGLVENSEVTLVASMLISPLMNPVMASTFGFVTRDWKLQSIGVLSELLGLLLCVLIGFLYGVSITYLSWESPDFKWPTPEMVYRGGLRSLLVGVLIALLAGAAVAIAVLGNYSCSLTGVAISASLMPPAVNAGLLWALAATAVLLGDTNSERLTSLTSEHPVMELMTLGALSLALTFINIICIFLTGIIVLKIKKVTPRSSKEANKILMKEQFQLAHNCQCPLSPAERIEPGPRTGPFTNLFNRTPYRFGLNQYTWSAYSVQEVNRPRMCDLESAWRQYTYQGRPRCSTAADQGCRPGVRGDLTSLWNLTPTLEGGNQTNTELNTAFINISGSTPLEPRRVPGRKFTITSCNSDSVCRE